MVILVDPPDASIRGVLWSSRGPWLILKPPLVAFGAGHPPEEMHKVEEVVIDRTNVAFLQVLP